VRELVAGDDLAIVASDGLWDALSPSEACAIALRAGDARAAARALADAALQRGSPDNVSVAVLDLRPAQPRPFPSPPRGWDPAVRSTTSAVVGLAATQAKAFGPRLPAPKPTAAICPPPHPPCNGAHHEPPTHPPSTKPPLRARARPTCSNQATV
jgi:hypothetical protein